jgi:hypothetical protein
LQRLLYERAAWSQRLWDYFAAGLVPEGGYLIVDDTCRARQGSEVRREPVRSRPSEPPLASE